MKCKKKQEMIDTHDETTKTGRAAMKGKCNKCGTNMYVMLPNDKLNSVKPKSKKMVKSKKSKKSKKMVKSKKSKKSKKMVKSKKSKKSKKMVKSTK
jgi:hypothetical protein